MLKAQALRWIRPSEVMKKWPTIQAEPPDDIGLRWLQMTIKLLVACREKQSALALFTQIVTASEGRIAGQATHLEGALRAASDSPPDVLLLQYTHSFDDTTRYGAWQVLSRIFAVSGNTRVLLLCDTYTQRSFIGFIQHGASGCVLASCEPSLFVKAVRTVHEGETWFGRTDLLHALRSEMHANPLVTSSILEDQELLTTREREILALIGTAMTNKEIARHLKISDHTVKTHLHHIYVKLDRSGRYKAFLSNTAAGPLPSSAAHQLVRRLGGPAAD
jgi:DNA-binding NarL/FixJ family response regulator